MTDKKSNPTTKGADEAPEVVRKVLRVRVGVPVLAVRGGPGPQYPDTGDYVEGNQEFDVLNIAGHDAWVEIAPGRWVQYETGLTTNLTPVG